MKRTADEGLKPFEFRPGIGLPGFRGMYRRGDPVLIGPNQFHLLVNGRLGEGDIRSRPGMTEIEDGTKGDTDYEESCITGIFEIDDFGVAVLITQYGGALGAGLGADADWQIIAFNEEKNPPTIAYWDALTVGPKQPPVPYRVEAAAGSLPLHTFRYYNGRLLAWSDTNVYEITFSEEDEPRMDVALLFTVPGVNYICSGCTRRERVDDQQTGDDFEQDVLYLGCDGGQIIRYDGNAIEVVHTLADASPAHVISYWGAGLVAAGDGGFSWQEQSTFAWNDETWGLASFKCNGLCEWNGEVVFVGDYDTGGGLSGRAFHWDGSAGSPTSFLNLPAGTPGLGVTHRLRAPGIAGGRLHFLHYQGEVSNPVIDGGEVYVASFETFASGDEYWFKAGNVTGTTVGKDAGFFIEFGGAMLLLFPNGGQANQFGAAPNICIVQIFGGAFPGFNTIYDFAPIGGNPAFDYFGYEAVSI